MILSIQSDQPPLERHALAERRKHQRYPMPPGTFAILRNEMERLRNHTQMSIGEIAMILYKSEPEIMGQVTDISFGGIAFDSSHGGVPCGEHLELDLLMAEQGIYLHNIPFERIPGRSADTDKTKTPAISTNILRFKNLDAEQKGKLQELLAFHVGPS
jgi:hypothetical protein